MPKVKLTKPVLDRLPPGELVRDALVAGFFAQRGASKDAPVALRIQGDLPRRFSGGAVQTVKMTIGHWPAMTLDAARAEAQRLLGLVKQGVDPRRKAEPAAAQTTVATMLAAYVEHLKNRARPAAPRTIAEFEYFSKKYLAPLAPIPVAQVQPSTLRELHERVVKVSGATVGNKSVRLFSAAYDLLRGRSDDPGQYQDRIQRAVEWAPEARRSAVIAPGELAAWHARVLALKNPLRSLMHRIGLFTGLRPTNLKTLRREWIELDAPNGPRITIPRSEMKYRWRDEPFWVPLSTHLVELVRAALATSEVMYAGAPWVFPSRDKGGEVIATAVIRERNLAAHETGHALRHTYRTQAIAARVGPTEIELLLDHAVGGGGVAVAYTHSSGLFATLLEDQEKISRHLLSLINPSK